MNVAIMGYGTVGSGVAEVLEKNHEHIVKKSLQESLELKYILDLRDFPGDPNENLVIKDFDTILNDSTVGVVVETMGGVEPAYPVCVGTPGVPRARLLVDDHRHHRLQHVHGGLADPEVPLETSP